MDIKKCTFKYIYILWPIFILKRKNNNNNYNYVSSPSRLRCNCASGMPILLNVKW